MPIYYPNTGGGGGDGDMEAATYDPQAIADDAFDLANMTGSNAAINTAIADAKTNMNVDADNTLPATCTLGEKRVTQDGREWLCSAANTWTENKTALSEPYATASGTDTYALDLTPNMSAYVDGQILRVLFTNANTGAATINVDTLGAKAITKGGATALSAGDIPAGSIKLLQYDGTRFQIIGDGGGGAETAISGVTAFMVAPFYSPVTGAAAAVSVNNQVRATRFYVDRKITVASLSWRITTLSGGGLMGVGIYDAAGTTKLIDSGATTTGSAAAVTATLGASVTLERGMYWLAWTADNTTAAVAVTGTAFGSNFQELLNAGTVHHGRAANASVAGVLPATLGAVTTNNDVPILVKMQG